VKSRWLVCIVLATSLQLSCLASAQEDAIKVLAWYPTAEVLPANQLKFYLHFSHAMEAGNVLEHFSLFDRTTGQTVPDPFRETELWDDARQRLTLWFHPGRQKTGVNLNVEIGPILEEGHAYELRIAPDLRSSSGQPLAAGSTKTFRAGPPRSQQLSLNDWIFPAPPPAGTRQPLTLRFPAPLDHALLQRCVTLLHAESDAPFPCSIAIADHETTLTFTPVAPWPDPAQLNWRILSILEDLAGNSLARPFQVDLLAPPLAPAPKHWTLPVIRDHPSTAKR